MQRGRARPDPVSCQSCRSKKLKCNRVQPCSNCVSRRISCDFLVPPPRESNAVLIARIERLESIVLKQPSTDQTIAQGRLDATSQQLLTPNSDGNAVLNSHQGRDHDSQLLEEIGTREDSLLPRLSNGIAFKISNNTHEMLEADHNPPRSSTLTFNNNRQMDTTVAFPSYRVATLLFQNYESNVDHLCRILHIPTTRSLIRTLYLQINQNEHISPDQAAVVLSVLAISAYFHQPHGASEIASSRKSAIKLSKILGKGALDVLDHSRRNTSGTLKDVQAYIFMSFVTYHLDGFSARGRFLAGAALSIARELRLHRVDAIVDLSIITNNKSSRHLIDQEVKRRVFWQIASTDWLFATISGPQEGVYFIQPRHISVNLPKDCSDDNLTLREDNERVDASQPTSMTLFLERVKLAHVSREIADTLPLETCKLLKVPYEQIIALDIKLNNFLSDLPVFFKADPESRNKSQVLETLFPQIPVSRYCITTEAHSIKCKLHQKFLVRQSSDPRYSYSRSSCLESARAVLQVYEHLRVHESPSCVPDMMGITVHFTHLALVVMAMDLCFNKDLTNAGEVKTELQRALHMFQNAESGSPLLARFLGSMNDVLRKHKVQFTDPPAAVRSEEMELDPFIDPSSESQIQYNGLGMDMSDAAFDEFWQAALQDSPDPDSLAWDNIFSVLDPR